MKSSIGGTVEQAFSAFLTSAGARGMIDELKSTIKQLAREIEYLKNENERKRQAIVCQQEHAQWLEGIVDDLRKR